MKRHLAVLIAVLALGGIAGCDDTDQPASKPATSVPAQPAESSAPSVEPALDFATKPAAPGPGASAAGPDHGAELFGSSAPTS